MRGLPLSCDLGCGAGLLTVAASLVTEPGLSACRLRTCGPRALLWDLPDQGSNLRPLHWRVNSYPLDHQGHSAIMLLMSFGHLKRYHAKTGLDF